MIKPGEVINNDTLSRVFRVANCGGMRRSLPLNHLVLIANWTKTSGVQNRWAGDVLHFVGQGAGDQQLTGQNRTLARSATTGETLHLFEVREPNRYIYRGEVALAGEPCEQQQADADGKPRCVLVFPLRLHPPGYRNPRQAYGNQPRPYVAPYLPAGAYAVVRDRIDAGKLAAVNAALDQLKALGVDIIDQRDVDDDRYQDAMNKWHADVENHMRIAARRLVAQLKSRHAAERRLWTYASDEVSIDGDANDDRIRQVLDMIGFGDQFPRLRDEAYAAIEQPPPPDHFEPDGPLTDEQIEELRRQASRVIGRCPK